MMPNRDDVIKHLEMTQGIINRLAHNSFLIKGWSMTILAVALLFISRLEHQSQYLILVFLIPVIAFWILDGYFLSRERTFRGIYDDIRMKDNTDFAINVSSQKRKPGVSWPRAMYSETLIIFYPAEILFIVIAWWLLL